MSRFVLTHAAVKDLSEIWDYTENTWGPTQADSYLRDIELAIDSAAMHPECGRTYPHIPGDYGSHATGRHLIFYRADGARIIVIRILREHMGYTRHLS